MRCITLASVTCEVCASQHRSQTVPPRPRVTTRPSRRPALIETPRSRFGAPRPWRSLRASTRPADQRLFPKFQQLNIASACSTASRLGSRRSIWRVCAHADSREPGPRKMPTRSPRLCRLAVPQSVADWDRHAGLTYSIRCDTLCPITFLPAVAWQRRHQDPMSLGRQRHSRRSRWTLSRKLRIHEPRPPITSACPVRPSDAVAGDPVPDHLPAGPRRRRPTTQFDSAGPAALEDRPSQCPRSRVRRARPTRRSVTLAPGNPRPAPRARRNDLEPPPHRQRSHPRSRRAG